MATNENTTQNTTQNVPNGLKEVYLEGDRKAKLAVLASQEDEKWASADSQPQMEKDKLPAGLHLVPLSRLTLWEDNPRYGSIGVQKKEKQQEFDKAKSSELAEDFWARLDSDRPAWDYSMPAVLLTEKGEKFDPKGTKAHPTQQGNRRQDVLREVLRKFGTERKSLSGQDLERYVAEYPVPVRSLELGPDAYVGATMDGALGMVEKSGGENQLAVLRLLQRTGMERTACCRYLWRKSRKLLESISDGVKGATTEAEAIQTAGGGVLQYLYYLAKMPESIIRLYFDELAQGVPNQKRSMNKKLIASLASLRNVLVAEGTPPAEIDARLEAEFQTLSAENAASRKPTGTRAESGQNTGAKTDSMAILAISQLLDEATREKLAKLSPFWVDFIALFEDPAKTGIGSPDRDALSDLFRLAESVTIAPVNTRG